MKILVLLSLLIFTSASYAQCKDYTVFKNGRYQIVQVCDQSSLDNSALLESIANSGGQNYETMRRGWIPTSEERNNRKLQELEIQLLEQQLNK